MQHKKKHGVGKDLYINNLILLPTQLVDLFPDGGELVQHFFIKNSHLVCVDHVNHTVNHVFQSCVLLEAGSIFHERHRGAKL